MTPEVDFRKKEEKMGMTAEMNWTREPKDFRITADRMDKGAEGFPYHSGSDRDYDCAGDGSVAEDVLSFPK